MKCGKNQTSIIKRTLRTMQDTNMRNLFTYIIEKKSKKKKKEFSSFNIIITTMILSLHIEKFHSETCLKMSLAMET